MIDISIAATRARGVRDNHYEPLDLENTGPVKLAGTARLSDQQSTFLGDWVLKHLPARQRQDFRLAVLAKLSEGMPGGAAFKRAMALAAMEFGFKYEQLESDGLGHPTGNSKRGGISD